jgi:hypothetical protein
LVEQLFRKQQVAGSSPAVGSRASKHAMPKWRNRQTRYVQGVVGVIPWEFKSPLRHHPRKSPNHMFTMLMRRLRVVAPYKPDVTRKAKGMVAGPGTWARGKSELRRAWVPGESRGSMIRHADSPDRRALTGARATETNATGFGWWIEKGNPPRSNLRFDRLQAARQGRKSRAVTKATT